MMRRRSRQPAYLAAGMAALCVTVGYATDAYAQDDPFGAFVDGEYVEGYVYVPEFMSTEELNTRIEQGNTGDIVIVDTAPGLVFEEEHIPGAVNFPWAPTLSLPITLPRNKTLVLYCACNDEEDSIDMAQKLAQFGYLNVKVLEGGWFEWLDKGYQTEGTAVEEESA